jgi:hypothetical protein
MYLYYSPFKIEGNRLASLEGYSSDIFGIYLYNAAPGSIINKNDITNFNRTYQYPYSNMFGIALSYTSNAIISNNTISRMNNYGSYVYLNYYDYKLAGIYIEAGSSNTVINNSIRMNGVVGEYSESYPLFSAGLYVQNTASGTIIKNNIFRSEMARTYSVHKLYGIWLNSDNPMSLVSEINNNSYSANGATNIPAGYGTGIGQNYMKYTIFDWRDVTHQDQGSNMDNPVFLTVSNLHVNGAMIGNPKFIVPTYSTAYPYGTDMDGENRLQNSYMGADEVFPMLQVTQDIAANPSQSVYCNDEQVVILTANAAITGYGDNVARTGSPSISYNLYKDGQLLETMPIGERRFIRLVQADSGSYYMKIGLHNGAAQTSTVQLKVETPITITKQPDMYSDVCRDGALVTLYSQSTGTISSYQWQKLIDGLWVDLPAPEGTLPDYVKVMEDPDDAAGEYRLLVNGPGNSRPAPWRT